MQAQVECLAWITAGRLLSSSGHYQESALSTGPGVCCRKQLHDKHPHTENTQVSFRLFLETEFLETESQSEGRDILGLLFHFLGLWGRLCGLP